jgi:zinc transport system substrate-binding protein
MMLHSPIARQSLPRAAGVLLIAAGLSNCAAPGSSEGSAPAAEELQVVTTFVPMTQFTKAVAGDRAEVTQLLPTTISPHDYQANPEDVRKLAEADVLVQNGLEMETFLDDLVQNAANPNLKIIDSSEGITTISNEAVEGHDHADDHAKEEAHDHADEENHAAEKAVEHEHTGESNPHIWLDPKRAMQQVERIRDGLIAADPGGKPIYTANAAAYIEQLKALDADITRSLQPFAGKTFVAFHDFAPYFADSYQLEAQFLVSVPEDNPSPADVQRVISTVKTTQLKTLLTEPQAGQTGFDALAQDLQISVSPFDPMETGGAGATEPSYYLSTMRENLKSLEAAFGRRL